MSSSPSCPVDPGRRRSRRVSRRFRFGPGHSGEGEDQPRSRPPRPARHLRLRRSGEGRGEEGEGGRRLPVCLLQGDEGRQGRRRSPRSRPTAPSPTNSTTPPPRPTPPACAEELARDDVCGRPRPRPSSFRHRTPGRASTNGADTVRRRNALEGPGAIDGSCDVHHLDHRRLDARRKKALYQAPGTAAPRRWTSSWGISPMPTSPASDADLDDYETLLDVSDRELFAWIVGTEEVDPIHDRPVWRAMREFTHAEKSVRYRAHEFSTRSAWIYRRPSHPVLSPRGGETERGVTPEDSASARVRGQVVYPSPLSLPHEGRGDVGAPTFETEPPGKRSELRKTGMSRHAGGTTGRARPHHRHRWRRRRRATASPAARRAGLRQSRRSATTASESPGAEPEDVRRRASSGRG